jgi:hypothetical protein
MRCHLNTRRSLRIEVSKWTAFPSARSPEVQSLGDAPREWTLNYWPKRSASSLQSVARTLADMHRRIRYAKAKGFRVGL